MLHITKRSENGIAFIALEGELDTLSSSDFYADIDGFLDGVTDLTIDLEALEYITSAGLRVLLAVEQTMEDQGEMRVIHVCEDVMDVFEVSGFTEVLNIE